MLINSLIYFFITIVTFTIVHYIHYVYIDYKNKDIKRLLSYHKKIHFEPSIIPFKEESGVTFQVKKQIRTAYEFTYRHDNLQCLHCNSYFKYYCNNTLISYNDDIFDYDSLLKKVTLNKTLIKEAQDTPIHMYPQHDTKCTYCKKNNTVPCALKLLHLLNRKKEVLKKEF